MSLPVQTQRRATSAAQAILREVEPGLIVDGRAGSYTRSVYDRADAEMREAIDKIVKALGASDMAQLFTEYANGKAAAVATGDSQGIFNLQVVPTVVRIARQRGYDPALMLTQLALESTWGKSAIPSGDGTPTYNYGGIKHATVRTAKVAYANTREFLNGKWVSVKEPFAHFDSAEAFVEAYIAYLENSKKGNSLRYPGLFKAKSARQFGEILRAGGYATDPSYPEKVAGVYDRVKRTYALA